MKNMKLKNKEGITLIALIITVIIMLILAAITIGAVTGDGLFNRTRKAADAYENSAQNEADIIGGLLDELDKIQGVVVDDSDPGNLGGTGTENDPYRIESIEDLVAFSNATNGIGTAENRIVTDRTFNENNVNKYEGKYVKLLCYLDFESDKSYMDPKRKDFGDINGDGTIDELKKELTTKEGTGFLPVGFQVDGFSSAVKAFQGVFEGNNKEIANVYVNQPNMSKDGKGFYCTGGIFGYVNNATIKNLTVSGNVVISSKINDGYTIDDVIGIGGIIGLAESSMIENLNTKVQMEHNIEEVINNGGFGGVVGTLANSTIKDSQNNSSKLGKYFGGIVGNATDSFLSDVTENNTKIINCVNNANFSNISTTKMIAGIVYSNSGGIIENCINNGNFMDISEISSISGIVDSDSGGTTKNCINNGDFLNIVGTGECAGIISSLGSGAIVENCINNGEINVQDFEHVGGISANIMYASNSSQVISCKNKGNITCNNVYSTGGIMGANDGENNTISNCDYEGEIIGGEYVGGILGECAYRNGTIIDNCKNQKLIKGTGDIAGIIGSAKTSVTISDSVNNGDVRANLGEGSTMNVRAAGILGVGRYEKIQNCYNTGKVYAHVRAAGIVAYSTLDNAIINNCYNIGSITVEGGRYPEAYGIAGGFRGPGEIYNCYNLGSISGEDAYGILGISSNYKIYNCYNLGDLVGENIYVHRNYTNSENNQNYVKNVFTKGTYNIGTAKDILVLNNIYNEKEFYSADGTYSSSPIDLKSQEFVDILNSFVDDYNKNVAEGGIILKRWKIDNSVEESQGYPIFE